MYIYKEREINSLIDRDKGEKEKERERDRETERERERKKERVVHSENILSLLRC